MAEPLRWDGVPEGEALDARARLAFPSLFELSAWRTPLLVIAERARTSLGPARRWLEPGARLEIDLGPLVDRAGQVAADLSTCAAELPLEIEAQAVLERSPQGPFLWALRVEARLRSPEALLAALTPVARAVEVEIHRMEHIAAALLELERVSMKLRALEERLRTEALALEQLLAQPAPDPEDRSNLREQAKSRLEASVAALEEKVEERASKLAARRALLLAEIAKPAPDPPLPPTRSDVLAELEAALHREQRAACEVLDKRSLERHAAAQVRSRRRRRIAALVSATAALLLGVALVLRRTGGERPARGGSVEQGLSAHTGTSAPALSSGDEKAETMRRALLGYPFFQRFLPRRTLEAIERAQTQADMDEVMARLNRELWNPESERYTAPFVDGLRAVDLSREGPVVQIKVTPEFQAGFQAAMGANVIVGVNYDVSGLPESVRARLPSGAGPRKNPPFVRSAGISWEVFCNYPLRYKLQLRIKLEAMSITAALPSGEILEDNHTPALCSPP